MTGAPQIITTDEIHNFDLATQITTMLAFQKGASIVYAYRSTGAIFKATLTPTWQWTTYLFKVDTTPVPMTVPSWVSIDPEYKWCAADENGCIFFYTGKPVVSSDSWIIPANANGTHEPCGAIVVHRGTVHWTETLIERPEGE